MAEVLGLASSVLAVAEIGAKVSSTLYKYIENVKAADERLTNLALSVYLTSSTLSELETILKEKAVRELCSPKAAQTAQYLLVGCKDTFAKIDQAVNKSYRQGEDGQYTITTAGRLKWPLREKKVELILMDLGRFKADLSLLLGVLNLGKAVTSTCVYTLPSEHKRTSSLTSRDREHSHEPNTAETERGKVRSLAKESQQATAAFQTAVLGDCTEVETIAETSKDAATASLGIQSIPSTISLPQQSISQLSTIPGRSNTSLEPLPASEIPYQSLPKRVPDAARDATEDLANRKLLAVCCFGLAALFGRCMEAFASVKNGPEHGDLYQQSAVRLHVLRLRLSRWGDTVRFLDGPPSNSPLGIPMAVKDDSDVIETTLEEITASIEDAKRLSARYKMKRAMTATASTDMELETMITDLRALVDRRQMAASLPPRFYWAICTQKTFDRLIEDLTELVVAVTALFPVTQALQRQLADDECRQLTHWSGTWRWEWFREDPVLFAAMRASTPARRPSSTKMEAQVDEIPVLTDALPNRRLDFGVPKASSFKLPVGALESSSPPEGDAVSWQWSGSRPVSEVAEVVEKGEGTRTPEEDIVDTLLRSWTTIYDHP